MARKPKQSRTHQVMIRYSEQEFEALKEKQSRFSCRTLSGYLRKLSLQEPVSIITRNGSFDSFVDEIVVLRKEMMALIQPSRLGAGNQQRLLQLQEEIRLLIHKIADVCMPK